MTDKKTEALKLALEALEYISSHYMSLPKIGCMALAAVEEALAEQPAKQECNHCGGTGDVSGEYPGVACPECSGSGVQAQPEFIKHEVENAYDWSEWVCPDPESYLMKCCDCGLVHEVQFRVAKYKPAPSDECQVVSDPDLQAQFRMRRSEQWSPADTAHRPGGLSMAEQPAQQQEPVGMIEGQMYDDGTRASNVIHWASRNAENDFPVGTLLYTSPPASKPLVGLTDAEMRELEKQFNAERVRTSDEEYLIIYPSDYWAWQRAIEAKLLEKNA